MKNLLKTKSGLVVEEDFTDNKIDEPLRVDANYDWVEGGGLSLNSGSIYVDAYRYSDLVLEVENSFEPTEQGDMGGLYMSKGNEKKEFLEYYSPTCTGTVPYVRMVKHGDVYTGLSSENGLEWEDGGYTYFPNAERLGAEVKGSSPYQISKLKLYLDELVTFYSLDRDWKIEAYVNEELVYSKKLDSDLAKVKLPYYPFTGNIKIYNDSEELVLDKDMEEVWGGDEYIFAVDVVLLTEEEIPLTYPEVQHLGKLEGGMIEQRFIVRNRTTQGVTVTIRVADYSPFGSWVKLAQNDSVTQRPKEYKSSVDIAIPSEEDRYMWLKIQKPEDDYSYYPDLAETECVFYLEVV